MRPSWQQRALGQLEDFDPGIDAQTAFLDPPTGELVGDPAVPAPTLTVLPSRAIIQHETPTLDAAGGQLNVTPPEEEEFAKPPATPAPNNRVLITLAAVGVVTMIGLGILIVATSPKKNPRKKKSKKSASYAARRRRSLRRKRARR